MDSRVGGLGIHSANGVSPARGEVLRSAIGPLGDRLYVRLIRQLRAVRTNPLASAPRMVRGVNPNLVTSLSGMELDEDGFGSSINDAQLTQLIVVSRRHLRLRNKAADAIIDDLFTPDSHTRSSTSGGATGDYTPNIGTRRSLTWPAMATGKPFSGPFVGRSTATRCSAQARSDPGSVAHEAIC